MPALSSACLWSRQRQEAGLAWPPCGMLLRALHKAATLPLYSARLLVGFTCAQDAASLIIMCGTSHTEGVHSLGTGKASAGHTRHTRWGMPSSFPPPLSLLPSAR